MTSTTTSPTKTPAKLTERFIEDTLDRLSNIEERLKGVESQLFEILIQAQIIEVSRSQE
jgi:hypothetical protein